MTVLDVLEKASEYLDLRQDLDYYFNEDNSTLPSTELQNKFRILLNALNLIVCEIAVEYKPLYMEEDVNFERGVCSLENLTQTVYKVVSVSDNTTNYNFKVVNKNIVCIANGVKTVKYMYIPQLLTQTDDVDCFDEDISLKTLTFGVVMEYFYLVGLLDEVSVWEDRFYKSLKNSLRNVGRINMPKRRWE